MNRLVRQLLFMFGPLILRQVTKMWKKKDKQKGWNTPQNQRPQRQERSNRRPEPEVIDVEPKLSEEERNFKLDEDDIMLEQEDLKYVKKNYKNIDELDDMTDDLK